MAWRPFKAFEKESLKFKEVHDFYMDNEEEKEIERLGIQQEDKTLWYALIQRNLTE